MLRPLKGGGLLIRGFTLDANHGGMRFSRASLYDTYINRARVYHPGKADFPTSSKDMTQLYMVVSQNQGAPI